MNFILSYKKGIVFIVVFIIIIFIIPFLIPRFGFKIEHNFKYKEKQILKDNYIKNIYSDNKNSLYIIYRKGIENLYEVVIYNKVYTVTYNKRDILLTLPNKETKDINESFRYFHNEKWFAVIHSLIDNDREYYFDRKVLINAFLNIMALILLIYPEFVVYLRSIPLYDSYEPSSFHINIIRVNGIILLLVNIGISLRLIW